MAAIPRRQPTSGTPNADEATTASPKRRRRGAALDTAIFDATLAEVAEVGYAALAMERVAERAQASKASLYRRWPNRTALVLDAMYSVMPSATNTPNTGSLRGDVLAVMRQTVSQLEGPAGLALRGLLGEALLTPEVAAGFKAFSRGNSAKMMREIVCQAAARGDCDPALVTSRRLEAGPALLRQRFIFSDDPLDDEYLTEVVDEVVLPLLGIDPAALCLPDRT